MIEDNDSSRELQTNSLLESLFLWWNWDERLNFRQLTGQDRPGLLYY